MLKNQLAPLRRDWSNFALAFPPFGTGVLFEEVTLDERIGPEAVALLADPSPDELLARRNLTLNTKTGVAATSYGPVLFIIWWIPPMQDGKPFAYYEQVLNPLNVKTSDVLRRLADQTHFHVLLTSTTGRLVTVFEYPNTFDFAEIRAALDSARVSWNGPADFRMAKKFYEKDYEVDDILAGRYD